MTQKYWPPNKQVDVVTKVINIHQHKTKCNLLMFI